MRLSCRTIGLCAGFALLTGLAQCENQTCFDYDENGERFEFPCTSCSESDGNPCTYTSWRIAPGEMCSLDQQPLVPDGEDCELDGAAGVCLDGSCQQKPAVLEVKTGTTTWAALTTPLGGGTPPAVTGGCLTFTEIVNAPIVIQPTITLEVQSLGSNEYEFRPNVETRWTFRMENPLFGAMASASQLGALDLNAVVTEALGGPIHSGLTEQARGQFLGAFYEVPGIGPLLLESHSTNANPNAITTGRATIIPTGGPGSVVNVNWDGKFTFRWDILGMPQILIDETTCDFNVIGTGVDFVAQ